MAAAGESGSDDLGPESGPDSSGLDPKAKTFPRHEQTFPALTAQEIERIRRFGELRRYSDGEILFETGKLGPGMFVCEIQTPGERRSVRYLGALGDETATSGLSRAVTAPTSLT